MSGKIIVKRMKSGSSLDLPMAGLAALSVAFVAFAMPNDIFTGAVAASGLPSVLPAAEPPLGTTARFGVIGAGAIAAFVLTWLLLRALGGGASPLRRKVEADEVEMPPLRLRRADAHPDAPLRRPLVAGLELGEPEAAEEPSEEPFEPEEAQRVPTFLVPEPPAEESDEPIAAGEVEDAEDRDGFEFSSGHQAASEEPMELEEPTIANLMERLERGLARRHEAAEPAAPESVESVELAAAPEIVAPVAPTDDRLRSALDELRMLAARSA